LNRTQTMLKVLKQAGEPVEIDTFFKACDALNPQEKGAYSYKRNMWKVTDSITKITQGNKTFVKLLEFDYDQGQFTASDMAEEIQSGALESQNKEEQNGTLEFIEPEPLNYLPRDPGVKYIEQEDEWKIINAHLNGAHDIPLLLEGPKGTGKTLAIQRACYEKGIHLIQFDCSENMKRYDLIGRFTLRGKREAKYVLGALATAIVIANLTGHCCLCLEEFNALAHNVQISLNQLTDFRKQVNIPELNLTFRLKPNCKLSIFATQNPSHYLGVNELNEAVRSRFVEYKLPYPTEMVERRIVAMKQGSLTDREINRLVRLAAETRKGVSSGQYSYALSPRDLMNFAVIYDKYLKDESMGFSKIKAWELATRLCFTGRYDNEQEKDTFVKRASRVLGGLTDDTN